MVETVLSIEGKVLLLENRTSNEKAVIEFMARSSELERVSEQLGVPYKTYGGKIIKNPNIQYADPTLEVFEATTFYTLALRANAGTKKGKKLRIDSELWGIDLKGAANRAKEIAERLGIEFFLHPKYKQKLDESKGE